MPSEHIRASLIEAGKIVKGKVGTSTRGMSTVVSGMFYITPEKLPLPNTFEIDKRSAVNQNIKARIITIRPKWKDWSVEFILSVDNDTITTETIKDIIEKSGSFIGIGSYRPQHKGQFGRYIMDSFQELKS